MKIKRVIVLLVALLSTSSVASAAAESGSPEPSSRVDWALTEADLRKAQLVPPARPRATREKQARATRGLAGIYGYPTTPMGFSCWGPIQNSYVIVIAKPFIKAFNTTAAQDFQLIYWRPTYTINGQVYTGPLQQSINWVPEGGTAFFYEPDPSFSVPIGGTFAVVHEYWWQDYRTGRWHHDLERDNRAYC